MMITVGVTTIVWLATTWLTPPEPDATLDAFYRKVRPQRARLGRRSRGGSARCRTEPSSLVRQITNAALGCVLVYSALFGVGEILLRSASIGVGLLALSAAAAFAIARNIDSDTAFQHTASS